MSNFIQMLTGTEASQVPLHRQILTTFSEVIKNEINRHVNNRQQFTFQELWFW